MGQEQSTLTKHGYVVEKTETKPDPDKPFAATRGDEKILIKRIPSNGELLANEELNSERKILNISHPHIVSCKNRFPEDAHDYVVTDYCKGGSLADKIKERTQSDMPEIPNAVNNDEFEVLSWIVEICMTLRNIHQNGLLIKDLTPEDIHFTEFGILRLGGYQKVYENLKNTTTKKSSTEISYLAPEVYLEGTYDDKSEIWSVGCILYELCTLKPAFSAESTIKLMPKILRGPYPTLPEHCSKDLCDLLNAIFNKDPESRPTSSEIMECPLIIRCLIKKIQISVDEVQTKVDALRALADGLERVHEGATIGSLTGGVIGAVGGITSIVGLILAPFTLGVSLIVTGVGVGVGAVGGVTAGAASITKMVNQSTDRKAVRNVIKEIEQKIHAVVTWVQELNNNLESAKSKCSGTAEGDFTSEKVENLLKLGTRAGRSLGGVAELIRLLQVVNFGRIAAQASRAVRVAEVATGVLSGLFIAVDIFFIAMDAKEIHYIRKAKAANEGTQSRSASEASANEDLPTFDDTQLLIDVSEPDTSQSQNQSPSESSTPVKSKIMKFVLSVRQAADNLQKVVDELKKIIEIITSPDDERVLLENSKMSNQVKSN